MGIVTTKEFLSCRQIQLIQRYKIRQGGSLCRMIRRNTNDKALGSVNIIPLLILSMAPACGSRSTAESVPRPFSRLIFQGTQSHPDDVWTVWFNYNRTVASV